MSAVSRVITWEDSEVTRLAQLLCVVPDGDDVKGRGFGLAHRGLKLTILADCGPLAFGPSTAVTQIYC